MSVKITSATFRNFGKFIEYSCSFDESVTYLCGPNGAGKTTIGYRGLWACIKGIVDSRKSDQMVGNRYMLIGDYGGKSSDVKYCFKDTETGAEFSISNHITKTGNSISLDQIGDIPITGYTLNDLLNVSLMSAKNFCSLSPVNQAIELGIDVSKFEKEMKGLKDQYTLINRDYKSIVLPENAPEMVEVEDIEKLKEEKRIEESRLNKLFIEQRENSDKKMRTYYEDCQKRKELLEEARSRKGELTKTLIDCTRAVAVLESGGYFIFSGYAEEDIKKFIMYLESGVNEIIDDLPLIEKPEIEDHFPDNSKLVEIEKRIETVYINREKNRSYEEYIKIKEKKESVFKSLDINKSKQSELLKRKVEYMKGFNFGFNGLDVNEAGELTLDGRYINDTYFSHGELEKIVALLHAHINPTLKVRFLDDFDLVDKNNQDSIIKYLTDNGFQIIIATVGENKGKNSIIFHEVEEKERLL